MSGSSIEYGEPSNTESKRGRKSNGSTKVKTFKYELEETSIDVTQAKSSKAYRDKKRAERIALENEKQRLQASIDDKEKQLAESKATIEYYENLLTFYANRSALARSRECNNNTPSIGESLEMITANNSSCQAGFSGGPQNIDTSLAQFSPSDGIVTVTNPQELYYETMYIDENHIDAYLPMSTSYEEEEWSLQVPPPASEEAVDFAEIVPIPIDDWVVGAWTNFGNPIRDLLGEY